MIVLSVVVTLGFPAMITQVGVWLIERRNPQTGELINVTGGRLRVIDIGPKESAHPPVVLLHGASSNLESMRQPLGDVLAKDRRVILIDRPGHGWSTRDSLRTSTPALQAAMIDEALGKMNIASAIIVGHSWAGALAPALALYNPQRVAGLVLLAPVTHPWPGGVAWHHNLGVLPVVGPLFAYTLQLPAGLAMLRAGAAAAFLPQSAPDNYVRDTELALLVRPREYLANAWDMATLKEAMQVQSLRYGEITAPAILLHGDADTAVSIDIHARHFIRQARNARLVVLPGIGHLVPNAATQQVVDAVNEVSAGVVRKPAAAAE